MSASRRYGAWRDGTWRSGAATAALLAALSPFVLLSPAMVSVAYAEPAPLRAHAHPNYGRMVFDWAVPVEVNARVEGSRLLLTFDRSVETQPNAAVGALGQYIAAGRIEPDGRTVVFDLKRPVTMRTFRVGPKVAVDLTFAPEGAASPPAVPAAAAPAPAAPAPASPVPPSAVPAATPAAASPPSGASPAPPPRIPARAGLRAAVRGADHPDYSRLVFDWPEDVNYAMQRDGRAVTMLFNKAAAAQLPRGELRNISNIESFPQANGALAVTFSAPQDSEVRDFRNGRSVVVDVRNPGTRQAPPPPQPDKPASPTVAGPTPAAPLPSGATTTTLRNGQVPPSPAAAPINGAPAAPTAPPPGPPPPPGRQDAAGLPPSPPAPAPTTPGPGPNPPPPPSDPSAAPSPPRDALTLTFDAGGPASMAAFTRGGFFYVVFDKPMPIGAGVVSGEQKELLGQVEPVPATGGSVYRTRIGPLLWPKIERKGNIWTITPSTRLTTAPPEELSVLPQPEFLLGARLLVRAADPGAAVQFTDPEIGDRLQVTPLPAPSQAVTRPHRYADLEIIPSFHGVAVRPATDQVTMRGVKEGIEISAAGGLKLSPADDTGGAAAIAALDAAERKGAAADPLGQSASAPGFAAREPAPLFPENKGGAKGQRLFDFTAWQHGGPEHYNDARQRLQLAVAEGTDEDRPRAVLDLARFYLSYGMGQEATGLLGLLSEQQPDLEAWPEFRAMRGVARYLTGDFAGALDDLSVPGLTDNTEAGLWRAAAAAGRRDWSVASAGFRSGGGVLATYPDPLLTRLSSEAADAFLHAGQPDYAQGLLDRLMARLGSDAESVPMMQYLRGEVARLRDDHELAKEMLSAAYGSLDRLVRAKAGLALTNLERADGSLSTEGAVDRLAGLTFIWRGDELEMDIRQRLGEIYVESGRYPEGFASLRETAAMQPNSPRSAAIANFMQRTFADLFKDGGAKMPVLDAMAFYDQYRELTPVGEEGDEVIRQLAERLAAIDLLARASDLYEHQVRFRLSGLDKARAGTRLASLRLLDNKPEDAVRALELSNVAGIPPDLDAERRTMHAKALAEMGREQEALQLLAKDDSRPADLLRVDIAWRAQKWEQAAIALSKVIGKPPANGKPLEPATSQLVLNRAVALALAGDGTGLNTMRKDFGAVMAAGPDADAFRILTRPEQATGLIDVDTIRSRVAEVDMFQNFLKGYRSRIGQPGNPQGSQPAAPPAPPAAPNS